MLRLYYSTGTCALATHIALEETGAPFEAVRVDFGAQAQRGPEYLAINPKGRVPALVTDRGTLTETPGLLVYVAQSFPAAELAPLSDPSRWPRRRSSTAIYAPRCMWRMRTAGGAPVGWTTPQRSRP